MKMRIFEVFSVLFFIHATIVRCQFQNEDNIDLEAIYKQNLFDINASYNQITPDFENIYDISAPMKNEGDFQLDNIGSFIEPPMRNDENLQLDNIDSFRESSK